MAAKIKTRNSGQHERPLTRETLSCLPYEFQKDRPFERKTTRSFDTASSHDKLRELASISSQTIQSNADKFVPHLQALNRVHEELQSFLSEQAERTDTGEETESIGLSLQKFFQELENLHNLHLTDAIIDNIYRLSTEYCHFKVVFRQIWIATQSENLRETLRELDIELDKAIKIIWRICSENDHKELIKQWFQLQDNLREQDQMIFALWATSEIEKDTEIQKLPSIPMRFSFPARVTLCAVLGLQLDSVEEFENIGELKVGYYSSEEWILMNLESTYRYLEDDKKHELTVDSLINLGFTEYAATALVDSIPTEQRGHRSTIDWVTVYIENQFKYNIFLAPFYYKNFPFKEGRIGNWFTLSNSETEGASSECNLTNVSMINLEGQEDERYTTQNGAAFPQSLEDDSHVVLFHGTDHLSSMDILFEGINLTKGRKRCDFSSGKGYYLTNDLRQAIDWAFGRPNKSKATTPKQKASVLVYRVEKRCLRQDRRYLDLTNDTEKWKKIVFHNITESNDRKLKKELDRCDYIEGPISTTPRPVNVRDLSRQPYPVNNSYQLCLKSDDFAEEFEKFLHSVLFYR